MRAGKVGRRPTEERLLGLSAGGAELGCDACAALHCEKDVDQRAQNAHGAQTDKTRSRESSFKGQGCEPRSEAGFIYL